jgi:hypothetical protein
VGPLDFPGKLGTALDEARNNEGVHGALSVHSRPYDDPLHLSLRVELWRKLRSRVKDSPKDRVVLLSKLLSLLAQLLSGADVKPIGREPCDDSASYNPACGKPEIFHFHTASLSC